MKSLRLRFLASTKAFYSKYSLGNVSRQKSIKRFSKKVEFPRLIKTGFGQDSLQFLKKFSRVLLVIGILLTL